MFAARHPEGWKGLLTARRVPVMLLYRHDLRQIPEIALDPRDRIARLNPALADLLPDPEHARRLASGHLCYAGWVDDVAAHFSWVQEAGEHEIRETGRRRRIQPGELWIYNCTTEPWARGRRLYPAALAAILRDARERGLHEAFIYALEHNRPSLAGIERAGFRLAERLRTLHLSGWRIPVPVLYARAEMHSRR